MENQETLDYIEVLMVEANTKVAEYIALLHEKRGLEMKAARLADYINAMNEFLLTEGGKPIEFNPNP